MKLLLEDDEVDGIKILNASDDQKQNMTLDGFSTTKDLDRQLETILKSIEPDVMELVKKIPKGASNV